MTCLVVQRSFATLALASLIPSMVVASPLEGAAQMLRSSAARLPRILSFSTVDTTETVYADEAQAWRMLGLYMDCQPQDDGTSTCDRYLLWAAYVDEDYSGHDLGEYMFYDTETGKWDDSACELSGSERCVKMDCHLRNTHFKVLGYYKQYGVNDFFEQLFAHQGSCSWSQSSYSFMENNRQVWPEGCSQSAVADEEGKYVYYDIKPLPEGKMTIGLYTDAICSTTYEGSLTVEEVLQGNNANDYYDEYYQDSDEPPAGSDEWLDEWNDALSTYRTCQPCKVASVGNGASARRLEDGEQNNGGNNNNNGGMFGCEDASGSQGANQCAMFAMNTEVSVASFRDVRLATLQGTITRAHGAGVTSSGAEKWWRIWGFFTMSAIVLLIGLLLFCCCVKVKRRTRNPDAKEPLLADSKKNRGSTKKSSKSTNRK